MTVKERREKVLEQMSDNSALILWSGAGMSLRESNRHFFYLTGLSRKNMILLMTKLGGKTGATLFIEEAKPDLVRWTGKRVSVEEAKETALIDSVMYLDSFESTLNRLMMSRPEAVYFDCTRAQWQDQPEYNLTKAMEFSEKYPAVTVRDLAPLTSRLRMSKDETEKEKIRKAIRVTDTALQHVLTHLKPGMMEYQAQADFEYMVHYQGSDELAFPTIAGSGANGTMLHYGTNRDVCKDGDLLLMDLGAKYEGYCADITRTYPVNGKYSPRQRQVYDIVLKANREVAAAARAGMTLGELQALCKKVLAEGCMELGLISSPEEIGKYYMHGVSHHLGIDCHDANVGGADEPLPAGTVISDEPGLYIDEWEIGIRIEDDLYLTEDGCEVLSEQVMRDPDEIESFMAAARQM